MLNAHSEETGKEDQLCGSSEYPCLLVTGSRDATTCSVVLCPWSERRESDRERTENKRGQHTSKTAARLEVV